MKKRLYLLKDVKDFASGAFENTAVEDGGIQLGRKGTGHLMEGSYTSPPFQARKFRALVPSWNADLPEGTHVELQARVAAGGQWSRWFSFGAFSPFIDRASPPPQQDELARAEGDRLTLPEEGPPADTAQLRVLLVTQDDALSPTVRLLALSVNSEAGGGDRPITPRALGVPAYSCLVRDPSIALRMGGATALCMLLNRWGEDLLPEEVARAAYDSTTASFENMGFLCAVGGVGGYECYSAYASLRALRREVWLGHAVAAQVRYRAPSLGEAPEEEAAADAAQEAGLPPVLEGATVDSPGHLVVVRGFEMRAGKEYVLVHDPMAPSDEAVRRDMLLADFLAIYTGLCVVLHKAGRPAGSAPLQRSLVQMSLSEGQIHLYRQQESLIPGTFTREELPRSTLCYTLAGGMAYASNAQRKFYYPMPPGEDGRLYFDTTTAVGRRITFYRVGHLGRTWVAETVIKEKAPAPAEADGSTAPDEKEAGRHDAE